MQRRVEVETAAWSAASSAPLSDHRRKRRPCILAARAVGLTAEDRLKNSSLRACISAVQTMFSHTDLTIALQESKGLGHILQREATFIIVIIQQPAWKGEANQGSQPDQFAALQAASVHNDQAANQEY